LPIQIDFGEAKTVAIVLSMIGLNFRLTQDMRNAAKMLGLYICPLPRQRYAQ